MQHTRKPPYTPSVCYSVLLKSTWSCYVFQTSLHTCKRYFGSYQYNNNSTEVTVVVVETQNVEYNYVQKDKNRGCKQ